MLPPGGDWVSGERVFGPPTGTLDADWLVPVVREAVPGVDHAAARAAVAAVWAVLREEAAGRGCAPGDVPEDALRARLGLPGRGLPGRGLATGTEAAHPDRSRPPAPVEVEVEGGSVGEAAVVEPDVVEAAVVAVRAAVRAYDAW